MTTARETRRSLNATTAPCCGSVRGGDLDESSAAAHAAGFAALADPVRLRLLSLIAAEPRNGVCVCDLVAQVNRSQPTVSHHLKVLRDAGLVTSEKRGTWAWYHIERGRLAELRGVLL